MQDIDQKSKDVVTGYMRKQESEIFGANTNNSYFNFPNLVIHLCLLFWYEITDEFDPKLCGEFIKVFNDNKSIEFLGTYEWSTVYGKLLISSMMNMTYIWKMKIVGSSSQCVNIGIDNAIAKWTNDAFHQKNEKATYSCHMKAGFVKGWNISWDHSNQIRFAGSSPGDIVTMTLKFENDKDGSLWYKFNESAEDKIAFTNIVREEGLDYRLAICLGNEGNSVDLIHFESYET